MSMNNLRSTPTGGNGGNGGNNDRPRLTDAEKKQNHIISEQKRRQAIRQGFDRLASLVPGMEGQGRSEALVLGNGVNSIKYHTALKAKLKKRVLREKPEMTESQFEAFYEQFLVGAFVTSNDADPSAAAGTSAAAGSVSSRTNSPRSVSSDGDGKAKGKGKVKQERR